MGAWPRRRAVSPHRRRVHVPAVATLVVTAGFFLGCAGKSTSLPVPEVDRESLPEWLLDLIGTLESQPVANPPAYIARYWYRNQVVYFLPDQCCDVGSVLYDADGVVLCSPSGGLAGGGDGRCPDFFDEREDEEIVWMDERRSRSIGGPLVVFLVAAAAQLVHIALLP